jgi:hypothetical protein
VESGEAGEASGAMAASEASFAEVTVTDAVALHSSDAPGGVHVDVTSVLLLQLDWQAWLTLQTGGVTVVSHSGAVYVTLHPPRQLTLAPQLIIASAARVQSPVHVPAHSSLQWVAMHGSEPHIPVQSPSHAPWHWACTETLPSHVAVALHVPLHWPVSEAGAQSVVMLPG